MNQQTIDMEKTKTKSWLQIDVKFNRLYIEAHNNAKRCEKLVEIWRTYRNNIFNSEIIANMRDNGYRLLEQELAQIPVSIYAKKTEV